MAYATASYGAAYTPGKPVYSATGGYAYSDVESGGDALYPGITQADQALRWGFITKVYGILAFQMTLTAVTCATVMFDQRVQDFVFSHPIVLIMSMVLPFVGLIPLWFYRQSHPLNIVLLTGWTVSLSIGIGMCCSMYPSVIVMEALGLTAGITLGLTAYTFWATANGKEFDFMGPWLFGCLVGVVIFGIINMFFPTGSLTQFIYATLVAVLFSAYIVYDTFELIKRFSVDDYVWASIQLYLDIVNLFLSLLEILGIARNN